MIRLKLYIAGLFFVLVGLNAQSIMEIRQVFHQAVLDPKQSEKFHEYLEDVNQSDATIKAYKAVSEAMLAQVMWNPFMKLSQVKKYNSLMQMAVDQDEDNIEIRFLRLAIEFNLPRFLGYSVHLDEDLDAIINNISSVSMIHYDPSFSRYILYFLNETGLCSMEQIELMKASIAQSNSKG